MNKPRPLVGVSRCLLGDAVRYDGHSKTNVIVIEQLSRIFELIAICPEVEAGLSVPRPPVQLTGNTENPKLIGRDDPTIDITDIMQRYCNSKITELAELSGFIFKSRSPSCGLHSTPVFIDGKLITEAGRGIFARTVCQHNPELHVIEDAALSDKRALDNFIKAVLSSFQTI